MNIDERLEALAQSVELLVSMHRDHEQRAQEYEQRAQENEQRALESEQRAEKRMAKLETYMAQMMQSITRLSNVSAVHAIRIDDHEKRIAELEQ